MSGTLFALVILQGTSLTFSPGYTTAAECLQQYKGPNVACFAYDAGLSTWTAFFKLPEGGFRTLGKISSEDECKRYVGAFKDGIPSACRQLAMPVACNVVCVAPVTPPPAAVQPDPTPASPPAVPQAAPPDPASLNPKPSDIQVGGKQYTKVAGLTWVERESTKPDSSQLRPSAFADVSVGPNDLQSKDAPTITPLPPPKMVRTAQNQRQRYAYAQPFDPLSAIVSLFAPRGDW
jgi:hypothetical protein